MSRAVKDTIGGAEEEVARPAASRAPRFSSPLIVIANPFEDILVRNGTYALLGDLAKKGLDTFVFQTMKEGEIHLKRDWKRASFALPAPGECKL